MVGSCSSTRTHRLGRLFKVIRNQIGNNRWFTYQTSSSSNKRGRKGQFRKLQMFKNQSTVNPRAGKKVPSKTELEHFSSSALRRGQKGSCKKGGVISDVKNQLSKIFQFHELGTGPAAAASIGKELFVSVDQNSKTHTHREKFRELSVVQDHQQAPQKLVGLWLTTENLRSVVSGLRGFSCSTHHTSWYFCPSPEPESTCQSTLDWQNLQLSFTCPPTPLTRGRASRRRRTGWPGWVTVSLCPARVLVTSESRSFIIVIQLLLHLLHLLIKIPRYKSSFSFIHFN